MEQTRMNESEPESEEQPPSFYELAESSSGFISAKNYSKGSKVKFKITDFEKMQKSEKFGTWQAIYTVEKDGEIKKYGMPGKIAATLKQQYGMADYAEAIGKTLTLLVIKTSSGSHTFEVVDFKTE